MNAYLAEHRDRFFEELFHFLQIPSISTLAESREDIHRAARFLQKQLEEAGADKAELILTEGNPLVYAEKMVDPALPTVLVYGHYDVQPVDPLHLWETPPFEPTLREGKVYARGASDDKGQLYIHVKAFEIMQQTDTLPCNIKFIIEGEEEVGSAHLQHFLQAPENLELLACDAVLVSDSSLHSMETPSIDIGLRGVAAFDLTVRGPARDLHSGMYGGAVANPAEMLCKILSQLKDDTGRILVPGFYEDVVELSSEARAALGQLFDQEAYKQALGVEQLFGEEGYTTPERVSIRPTLEVNGIMGGYTGEGIKTVLPAKASAKLTIRTVPHQDTQALAQKVRAHIASLAPKGVEVEVKSLYGDGHNPFLENPDCRGVQAASAAFEAVWGKRPLLSRRGGSIPILLTFKEQLKADVVNMGFGLESDQIHSPNESFGLQNFIKGIETVLAFYPIFAQSQPSALPSEPNEVA